LFDISHNIDNYNFFFSVFKRVCRVMLFCNLNFSMYSWEYNIPMSIPRKNFLWNCQFHQDRAAMFFFRFLFSLSMATIFITISVDLFQYHNDILLLIKQGFCQIFRFLVQHPLQRSKWAKRKSELLFIIMIWIYIGFNYMEVNLQHYCFFNTKRDIIAPFYGLF